MEFSSLSNPAARSPHADFEIPLEVRQLFRREREIATYVYSRGCATAKEVGKTVASDLTNPAIRSMLNRLVRKGILTRLELPAPLPFIYAPGMTTLSVREQALKQLADDLFDGSLRDLASAIVELHAAETAAPNLAIAHCETKRRSASWRGSVEKQAAA